MLEYVPHDIFNIDVRDNCLKFEVGKNESGRMCIEFSFCGPNAIKVSSIRGKHKKRTTSSYISTKPYSSFTLEQTDSMIILKAGMFEIDIHKNTTWQVDYIYMGNLLTTQYTDSSFTYNPDCVFYGIGNDNSNYLLNNSDIRLSSTEENPTISQFFMSSDNWGIMLNSNHNANISFGTIRENTIIVDNNDEHFEFIMFVGNSPKNLLKDYLDISSNNFISPSGSFGTAIKLHDNYDITANELITYIDSLIQSGFVISALYLGYSYLPSKSKLGFTFDNTRFSDSLAFSRKLHDRGILLGVTVNPYISAISEDFDECYENNTMVKDSDDNIVIFEEGNESFAILDFTHIAPRSYLQLKLDSLLRSGVDILECDFNPRYISDPSIKYSFRGNYDSETIANQFTKSINEAFYETTSRYKGVINSFIVSSVGSFNSNIVPLHNITNTTHTANYGYIGSTNCAEYMRQTLNSVLKHAGVGYDAINVDIPSYATFVNSSISAGDSDMDSINESYTALAINSAMVPHMRILTDNSNKDFTGIDTGILNELKTYLNLKNSMLPYLYATSGDSNLYGTPSVRPMFLEFGNDTNCSTINYEYMLGTNLLVVPSVPLNDSDNSGFYIPNGNWTELLSNTKIKGPGIVNYIPMGNRYSKCQIFVRPNSIIPLLNSNVTAEGNGTDRAMHPNLLNNLTFMVYELQDSVVAATEVYASDMQASGVINILRKGNKIKVLTRGFGDNKRIMLSGINNIVSTSDGIPQSTPSGTLIEFNSTELMITLG